MFCQNGQRAVQLTSRYEQRAGSVQPDVVDLIIVNKIYCVQLSLKYRSEYRMLSQPI